MWHLVLGGKNQWFPKLCFKMSQLQKKLLSFAVNIQIYKYLYSFWVAQIPSFFEHLKAMLSLQRALLNQSSSLKLPSKHHYSKEEVHYSNNTLPSLKHLCLSILWVVGGKIPYSYRLA